MKFTSIIKVDSNNQVDQNTGNGPNDRGIPFNFCRETLSLFKKIARYI